MSRLNVMLESLVSVVIPTFNRKLLLEEAVASCLAQTHQNVEVIIVDDGSTDGTETFVADKMAGDWRLRSVRYYKKSNNGPAAARQYGLDRAKGEFIQFLDSDDLILPTKLERQIVALLAAGPDAVGCSCVGRKGNKVDGFENARRVGYMGGNVAEYIHAMCLPISFPMQCSAPLWRRSFLASQRGWPEDLCCSEDWVHYVSLLLRASAIAFVDDELFWICDHEGERASVTNWRSDKNLPKLVSEAKGIQRIEKLLRDAGIFSRENQKGLLRISRSVYFLLLEINACEELTAFEKQSRRLATKPYYISAIEVASWFRLFFGVRLTRWTVRKFVRNCAKNSDS